MRKPLILGNWKMNGCLTSNEELLKGFAEKWSGQAGVGVCVPSIYISQVINLLRGTNIDVGAQDVSKYSSGAYTGEIAASMIAEVGCRYVIVGHSERRQYHGEQDRDVAEKFVAALNAGLIPVLCVGESLEERDSGDALNVIAAQIAAVIDVAGVGSFAKAVVAYEPVWAIGTGKTATPEQAQEVHEFIRSQLGSEGEKVQILYGGSVKGSNAQELFGKSDIDGALVGGASLQAEDFAAICFAADA